MEIFECEGYFGNAAVCGVTMRRSDRGSCVVVLTELPDNPGTSVTNRIETIAAGWVNLYALNPFRAIWIEHYPETPAREESFDLVTLDWAQHGQRWHAQAPDWRCVSRQFVEELLGGESAIPNF